MKTSINFLIPLLFLFAFMSCSEDENTVEDEQIIEDEEIIEDEDPIASGIIAIKQKEILLTERTEFTTANIEFEWTSEFENATYHYNIYLGETADGSPIKSGQGTEVIYYLQSGKTYTLSVATIVNDEIITEYRVFEVPSYDSLSHLDFEIGTNYNGYTAINFVFEGLQPSFKNKIHFESLSYNVETTLINYYDEEYLLSDLQVDYLGYTYPSAKEYIITFDNYQNDSLGIQKDQKEEVLTLRRLPDDELDVYVHNIQNNQANTFGIKRATNSLYNQIEPQIKLYLNDEYLGAFHCGFPDYNFHLITGLTPGTAYVAKFLVGYGNPPINPLYEPEFPLNTTKEIEFTTYTTPAPPLQTIYADVVNVGTNKFDFYWRLNTNLYGCSPGEMYQWGFILEIDGEQYMEFDESLILVNVDGLSQDTEYSVKLIFWYNFYHSPQNLILIEHDFDIQTLP